jgi:predicted nucleic acid-binding protein
MISAIDSSVILDVLTDSPAHARASMAALREAMTDGKLIVCECVMAEIFPAIGQRQRFEAFFNDWQLEFVPSNKESAVIAGEMFSRYLKRSGEKKKVLPDFLIAAHAMVHADRLIARDRGYFKDDFSKLTIVNPSV